MVIYYLNYIIYFVLIFGGQLKDNKKTKTSIIPSFFRLNRYRDSNYTKNFEDKKCIMGYCFFINKMVIF